jgi:hypothetical protein
MNIEIATLKDGGVMLVSDRPLPHVVKRVEFYRDQKLVMLVYNNTEQDSDLMHYELPENMVYPVEKSPDMIIFSLFPNEAPVGYKVPLIKVGDIY